MNLKIVAICSLFIIYVNSGAQVNENINKTDKDGRKQGHWIKKYPNGNIQYDGFFKDSQPQGEFRRYDDDSQLRSVLIFNNDGKEALVTIYHTNGFIASKGKYINQLKEGKWQFFSALLNGYLICEEVYSGNLKNGPSLKFYMDSTIAERVYYVNNIKHGEWIQYFPDGSICVKSTYVNGKLQGKFEAFFENGKTEFSGQYEDDARNGLWHIYKNDGTVKYEIEYVRGVPKNSQMDKDESDYLDTLEKNKGEIADPEQTGEIWE